MHQNYDISSQTEIYYRSTINLEALKHARPTRRKNIVWRERKRHSKKKNQLSVVSIRVHEQKASSHRCRKKLQFRKDPKLT